MYNSMYTYSYIIHLNECECLNSGQSGSGKTEAAKLIVHYLSSMYQGRNDKLRQVKQFTNPYEW